jgi:hypothetical protein
VSENVLIKLAFTVQNLFAAEKNVNVMVDLAGCQNHNFGSGHHASRGCQIE